MSSIVITGASRGIGRAVALAFAKESDTRLTLVSRNIELLEEVAASCRELGAETAVHPCDVTDEDAVADLAKQVVDRWGAPDVLVNNAGLFQPATFLETTPAAFREQVDVNLTSAFLVTRAFLEPMLDARHGSIFYMASVASIRAYPSGVAYCAAKHGLLGLARSVREETRPFGIRVTAIIAGATFTPSWEGVDLPEERFMPPEDIARTVLDIVHLSDRSVVEEILIRPQPGDI